MERGYHYYAFISYNHHDVRWAKKLQRRLERYRLPTALCREQPGLPKRICPVFLDSSDLVASSTLLESLRRKLDESRCLIVLCSPNSAASPWVNDEVEHFIRTGRRDRIIPFIIDGEPHAADPARECYPPALASLTSQEELLGISVAAHGERGAFLRLIATLLELRLEQVASRDKAARRRRGILYGAASSLAALALAALIWYNVPHTAYYTDYTYRWEAPVGLGEVSSRQRKQMDYTYRFTTLRGDVTQVERVNSAGTLVRGLCVPIWEDPPRMRFYYGSSDRSGGRTVTHVTCYDLYGREQYEKHYSADLTAVDFVQSGNGGASFSLGTDLLASQAGVGARGSSGQIEDRGDAIRYIQTYDENGYLVRRMFKRDNRGSTGGTPTQDSNGVWGVGYLRDELGRPTGMRYLDRDGEPMAASNGVAGSDYIYDEGSGRVSVWTRLNIGGEIAAGDDTVASMLLTYDGLGRLTETACFGPDGERTIRKSDGISVFHYGYDKSGFLVSEAFYDHELEPCYAALGFFQVEVTVDGNGRMIRLDYYDADGAPIPGSSGYASVLCTLDANGLILEERYLDTEGAPTPDLDLNIYALRSTFEDGLYVRVDYLDDRDRPMTSKRGYASICREYNDQREMCREWYLDAAGERTATASGGYAEAVYTYTDGNRTRVDYYDEAGARCLDSEGVASYVYTYEAGSQTSLACFGTEGEPVLNADGYHIERSEYDDYGHLLRKSYYGVDGERVFISEGWSAIAYTYDVTGRVLTENFYDKEDREWDIFNDNEDRFSGYQRTFTYDGQGNRIRSDYLKKTGRLSSDVSSVIYTYDGRGNITSVSWLDAWGEPANNRRGYTFEEYTYDEHDRRTGVSWYTGTDTVLSSREAYIFNELGQVVYLTAYAGDNSISGNIDYVYDAFGNCIETVYLDRDGRPSSAMWGVAYYRSSYDVFGNQTDVWCYDESGAPCLSGGESGVFHVVKRYGATGRLLALESFDTCEQPLGRRTYTYDRYGRLVEEWSYDGQGVRQEGVAYTYSSRGQEQERIYYNGDGTPVNTTRSAFCMAEVFDGRPAAAAGLCAWDMFITYGGWTFDSMLEDPDESLLSFSQALQDGGETEKELTICRHGLDDGTELEFFRLTLPAGAAGYRVVARDMSTTEIERILETYHRWLGD